MNICIPSEQKSIPCSFNHHITALLFPYPFQFQICGLPDVASSVFGIDGSTSQTLGERN